MSRLRTLLGIDADNEARFFLFVGFFGWVVTAVYWFISYEHAGSVLLAGFSAASVVIGFVLAGVRPSRSKGAEADDRPFLDETGRIPAPTLAPLAIGVGLSISATSLVFGAAPLLVGVLPLAWGALAWLAGARAELDATSGERRDGQAR